MIIYFILVGKRKIHNKCRICDTPETVKHFLIDCPGTTNIKYLKNYKFNVNYIECRNRLKHRLKATAMFYKNPINFTVNNLLFPHTWQVKPHYKDPNRKQKLMENVRK